MFTVQLKIIYLLKFQIFGDHGKPYYNSRPKTLYALSQTKKSLYTLIGFKNPANLNRHLIFITITQFVNFK